MAGPDFPLRRELAAFEAARAELVGRAAGKFALFLGDDLGGIFDTEADAINQGYQRYGNVPFLAKQITPVDVPEHLPATLAA